MRMSLLFVLLPMLAACQDQASDSHADLGSPDLSTETPADLAASTDLASSPDLLPPPIPPDLSPPYDLAFIPGCTVAGTQKQQFVLDTITLPPTRNDFAFDVNGDGRVDNQLGNIIGALSAIGTLQPQQASDQALAAGQQVMLVDEVSTDPAFITDSCAGSTLYNGKDHVPGPGVGTYQIEPSLQPGAFAGTLASSTFHSQNPVTSADVQVTLRLSILGPTPVDLPLHGAHLQYQFSGGKLVAGQLNGVVTQAVVQTMLIPRVATLLDDTVKANPTSAQSSQIRTIFDTGDGAGGSCTNVGGAPGAPNDGTISACEVAMNTIIKNVLAPDVQMFQNGVYAPNPLNTVKDSLSVGVGFTATPAIF
jgi:hypothetical protein